MANRAEIALRKSAMLNELRGFHGSGRSRAGTLAPTVRELSEKFNLSTRIVGLELDTLVAEGMLYKVPRVGAFFGQPQLSAFEFYLLCLPRTADTSRDPNDFFGALQAGFEERIAQLGGTSLAMTQSAATKNFQAGALPPLAGVFHFGDQALGEFGTGITQVCFQGHEKNAKFDSVSFDNHSGGRLATRHLLQLGYERIAFLGLHQAENSAGQEWSAQREEGWAQTLKEAGCEWQGLAIHPVSREFVHRVPRQMEVARKMVAPLLEERGLILNGEPVSAVVAANDAMALGLLEALRDAEIAPAHWPALVGFDNLPCGSGHVLTSLRLPWEELGRTAADLLWERKHGELAGPSVERQIPMRLIARLTCRNDWSASPAHAALVALT